MLCFWPFFFSLLASASMGICQSMPVEKTSTPIPAAVCKAEGGSLVGSCKMVKVSQQSLFVSEPNPNWFGNDGNTPSKPGWNNKNWLKSRFHFNFAEYSGGPSNFGVLRVMNDDLVQPDRGFGTHPHRDMEIITLVVDGHLTHKDSMGTSETLGRGSVQFMTAGTGIQHSEHNLEKEKPLRFVQSWVTPRTRGLKPNYGSHAGDDAAARTRRNQWAHLISDAKDSLNTPVKIQQDCNVFLIEMDANSSAPIFELKSSRAGYALIVEGSVSADKESFVRHDAVKLYGPLSVVFRAGHEGAMIYMFEMAG